MRLLKFFLAMSAVIATPAIAQETESVTTAHDTMIVLDASGSMWGQIDGDAKISIATFS